MPCKFLWLVAEKAFNKNSRKLKPGAWLFTVSWYNVIKAFWLYEIVQES